MLNNLNGAHVLLAGTLLLWAPDCLKSWHERTNQLRDSLPQTIQSLGEMILSDGFCWLKLVTLKWNIGISLVFDWCGSDSLIRVKGRWIGSHLSILFFGAVLFPCHLLFSQPCFFIWWQWYLRGTDDWSITEISWFIFFWCCCAAACRCFFDVL